MEWDFGTKQVCHGKTRLARSTWAKVPDVQANISTRTIASASYPISERRRQTWNEEPTTPLPCLSYHNRELWDKPEDMRESRMIGNGHVRFGGGGKSHHLTVMC